MGEKMGAEMVKRGKSLAEVAVLRKVANEIEG